MNFCAYEGKAGNVSSLAGFAESQTKARGFRPGGSAPFPSHLPARDAAWMLLQQGHIWPQQCWQSGDQPSKNQWELGPGSSLGRLRLEAGWEWEIPALLRARAELLIVGHCPNALGPQSDARRARSGLQTQRPPAARDVGASLEATSLFQLSFAVCIQSLHPCSTPGSLALAINPPRQLAAGCRSVHPPGAGDRRAGVKQAEPCSG